MLDHPSEEHPVKSQSQIAAAMPPGPNFVSFPVEPPPGAVMALHVDMNGKAIAFVWVAAEHAGPGFVEDSWMWWDAHQKHPTPSPAFLRLVAPDPAGGASGGG